MTPYQIEVDTDMANAAILAVHALMYGEHTTVLVFCDRDSSLWSEIEREMPDEVIRMACDTYLPYEGRPEWYMRRLDCDALVYDSTFDYNRLTIVLDETANHRCVERIHKVAPHADVIIGRGD